MAKLGMLDYFIQVSQLLFKDACAFVCINNKLSESFPMKRGVLQGCPIALYLFLMVGEALHAASMATQQAGNLSGILLPSGQQ